MEIHKMYLNQLTTLNSLFVVFVKLKITIFYKILKGVILQLKHFYQNKLKLQFILIFCQFIYQLINISYYTINHRNIICL